MKKHARELIEYCDFAGIADLAASARRILGVLVSLTFDPDPIIGWRAVEAMGVAAHRIAVDDPECVREHLRRLYWLLSEESGGICWRSPEAMAEIVRQDPETFADYAPIVVSLLGEMAEEDLAHFRPGILWAIGRLGPLAKDSLETAESAILACLDHADPQVRGMAVWCLGQCGRAELLAGRPELLDDKGPVNLYENGRLTHTRVGDLVQAQR